MKNYHANTEYFRVSSKRIPYSKYTTRIKIFTESCWLRILGPHIRWACVRKKNNVGNNGILTLLSLCDFSLSNFFSSLRDVPHDTIDFKIGEFHLGMIKYPEALMILCNLALPKLTGTSSDLDEYDSPRYALFRLFELLYSSMSALPPKLTGTSSDLDEYDSPRYALFKLFELLFHVNHQNHAILCGLGLIKSVFTRFYEMKMDAGMLEKERHVHRSC
jgi:hypothetical protein